MTDINEKDTMQYFLDGVKKAKSAARELADLNQRKEWIKIRSALGQIEKNAIKLYEAKPQTRLQTLLLAAQIEKANNTETLH
jgi:hypothetical protein